MNVDRRDSILGGLQATARKLYEIIPNGSDGIRPYQINQALQDSGRPSMIMTGMEKVLCDLLDHGLIRIVQGSRDKFSSAALARVPVKASLPKLSKTHTEDQQQEEKVPDKPKGDQMEQLILIANSLREIATRIEDVALENQKVLEESKTARAKLDALREALR